MTGPELARAIAEMKPQVRCLYVSGKPPEELVLEQRPGATARFLQKPFTAGDMARALRSLLDTPVPVPEAAEPTPHGTESVLVVDDDPTTRRFMTRALERLGYHILEAQYPDRALAIAENSRIHLIVMDVVMPEMTGPELARAIAEMKPQVRCLYVSGKPPEELVLEQRPGAAGPGAASRRNGTLPSEALHHRRVGQSRSGNAGRAGLTPPSPPFPVFPEREASAPVPKLRHRLHHGSQGEGESAPSPHSA